METIVDPRDFLSLSHNFHLREFLISEIAARIGRDVVPTDEEIENLRNLCSLVLQPARDYLNTPFAITSGLRPVWLNRLVKGAKDSDHIYGRAADFNCVGYKAYDAARAIAKLNLPFKQLIVEYGKWVHMSIGEDINSPPKREMLTAVSNNGKIVYLKGLVDV